MTWSPYESGRQYIKIKPLLVYSRMNIMNNKKDFSPTHTKHVACENNKLRLSKELRFVGFLFTS
jgi:hypothetical protein